jgi:hypothetical protein
VAPMLQIGQVHVNSTDGLQHDYDADWCTNIVESQQFYYAVFEQSEKQRCNLCFHDNAEP